MEELASEYIRAKMSHDGSIPKIKRAGKTTFEICFPCKDGFLPPKIVEKITLIYLISDLRKF